MDGAVARCGIPLRERYARMLGAHGPGSPSRAAGCRSWVVPACAQADLGRARLGRGCAQADFACAQPGFAGARHPDRSSASRFRWRAGGFRLRASRFQRRAVLARLARKQIPLARDRILLALRPDPPGLRPKPLATRPRPAAASTSNPQPRCVTRAGRCRQRTRLPIAHPPPRPRHSIVPYTTSDATTYAASVIARRRGLSRLRVTSSRNWCSRKV